MKFNVAWARTAAQNVGLKLATITLAGVTLVQLAVNLSLATKDLYVIERGCFSQSLQAQPFDPSISETEAFLIEALSMRFNSSGYLKDSFLSLDEMLLREKDLAVLKQRQITQRIVVNEIKSDDKNYLVFADRILSVGKLKSVLSFNLKVTLQKSNRTESNPYGLILTSVNQIQEKEEK